GSTLTSSASYASVKSGSRQHAFARVLSELPTRQARRFVQNALLAVVQAADNDRRVVSAKAKAVAHGDIHASLASLIGSVVQIAPRPGAFQVDRGWNEVIPKRKHGDDQLHAAAGPQQVAQLALGA